MRNNIIKAREEQRIRFSSENIYSNSGMNSKQIESLIILSNEIYEIISKAQKTLWLSHRAIHRIIKVARSIADYEKVESISSAHILEAIQYRGQWLLIDR